MRKVDFDWVVHEDMSVKCQTCGAENIIPRNEKVKYFPCDHNGKGNFLVTLVK